MNAWNLALQTLTSAPPPRPVHVAKPKAPSTHRPRPREPQIPVTMATAVQYVAEHPGCTSRELAEHYNQRVSSMSNMLRRAVAKGLLSRRQDGPAGDRCKTSYYAKATPC